MSDRLVITGAGGLLGRTLVAAAPGRDVLALTSADCDITDPLAIERHVRADDVVINCAAYTKVDEAERDEARAYAVNATGAENVAHACARAGARLIHVSTDYVFSGRFADGEPRPYEIDDETDPLSVYGRTKLAGEFNVLAAMPDAHVVRTSWIFGGAADFVAAIGKKAAGDDDVDVVADQVGGPTYVGDLAQALLEVAAGVDLGARPARRQRRRGQPIRAGQGRVRVARRRSRARPARRHRPASASRATARVLRAVRTQVDRSGAHAAATVARGVGRRARRRREAGTSRWRGMRSEPGSGPNGPLPSTP